MPMNWTDERVELLRKLWGEGLSASRIAAQIGGVTRNAVIGKVHRMKLSNQGRAAASSASGKKKAATVAPVAQPVSVQQATQATARAVVAAAAMMRPVTATIGATALQAEFDAEPVMRHAPRPTDNVVIPISRRLRLVQLNERTCKWPNGDPLSEDFNFCGNECAEAGPYCRYHARIAFQPASERRRVR
jgi:GcrA cell cycle regulator